MLQTDSFEKHPVVCYSKKTGEPLGEFDSLTRAASYHGLTTDAVLKSTLSENPYGTTSRKTGEKVYFKKKLMSH